MTDSKPLLAVRDLVIEFATPNGPSRAVDGVSFDLFPNEVLGIVGESGSGKSIMMLAIMGLLPSSARVVSGDIRFQGQDLRSASSRDLRSLRGSEMAMIFQDPLSSLNPTVKIGRQVGEIIRLHHPDMERSAVRTKVIELLRQVNIPSPKASYSAYPHEFSGGMRQRVMIATAMANSPAVLIADEPTTALDVTIQSQVLEVLRSMRERTGSAMILITHDLSVVAETADRVIVMYSGQVMESREVHDLFHDPAHPYTVGLLASLLPSDSGRSTMYTIPGQPTTLFDRPVGCQFHPRCGMRRGRDQCESTLPELGLYGATGRVACHFADETARWSAEQFPQLKKLVTGVVRPYGS